MSALYLQGTSRAAIAAGLALFAAQAQGQAAKNTMPDAQIEANVLRALAGAPEMSTQNIQSTTVYGTVTLSGNVHDEALRSKAENLVARAEGVKKVVDELTLGDTPAAVASSDEGQAGLPQNGNDESYSTAQDTGAYAPSSESASQAPPMNPQQSQQGYPAQPYPSQPYPDRSYPAENAPAYPQQGQPYPSQQAGAYPGDQPYDPGYNDGQAPPRRRRPLYNNAPGYGPDQGYAQGPQGGQPAGLPVTVPGGAILQVRINRGIDSNHIQPGTPFDGTVLTDIAAGGLIAIPRGALVTGQVVDAKHAGALKGQGELALRIDSVTLGGTVYPVVSEIWNREGHDKSLRTVNSALGGGVLGAIIGGVAGGGAGAAIGAGVGAGVGVASSAGSPGGKVIVPPESVLTFRLAQPVPVQTVSQQEMSRLAYGAGPATSPRPVVARRRYYSPYPYYGPYPYPSRY